MMQSDMTKLAQPAYHLHLDILLVVSFVPLGFSPFSDDQTLAMN